MSSKQMNRREMVTGSALSVALLPSLGVEKADTVVSDREIRIDDRFVFDRYILFENCRFSGEGSFVIPAEFATEKSGFVNCRFDSRERKTLEPWITCDAERRDGGRFVDRDCSETIRKLDPT